MHKGVPFDGVQLGFCFVTAVSLSLSLSWFSETGFLLVVLAVLELGDLSAPAGIKAFTTTARPASLFFLMVKKARVTVSLPTACSFRPYVKVNDPLLVTFCMVLHGGSFQGHSCACGYEVVKYSIFNFSKALYYLAPTYLSSHSQICT